jgi:hypothetical protein
VITSTPIRLNDLTVAELGVRAPGISSKLNYLFFIVQEIREITTNHG